MKEMSKFGIIIVFLIIFSIYVGANYYVAKKTYQWLSLLLPNISKNLYIGIYIFIAFSTILVFLPIPSGIKSIISRINAYWMGVFIYLLIFLLLTDLIILTSSMIKIIPSPIPQHIRFYAGLIAILLTTGFVSYGLYNAKQIKFVSYDIQTKGGSLSDGIKIALISDLHIGAVNSEINLGTIVQYINNLNPDLVCIAGDIFNDDYKAIKNPSKAIDLLKGIKSAYGVYACLGNHDGGNAFSEMMQFLEKSNIRLLNDEHVIINDELILIGRVDPSPIGGFGGLKRKEFTDILALVDDKEMPIVVMDHTPAKLEQYEGKADLVLAGHTHKGQIFPGNLITNIIFTVDYGHYQKNSNSPHIIVSSGAGTWGMPMRIGSNNEIVSIILR